MTKFKKTAASIAAIIAVAGLGAALYSCSSSASSPSGDMSKGNPARSSSYYNHIWLEGPAGKTEFDENSVWGADEWENLFHAFKKKAIKVLNMVLQDLAVVKTDTKVICETLEYLINVMTMLLSLM